MIIKAEDNRISRENKIPLRCWLASIMFTVVTYWAALNVLMPLHNLGIYWSIILSAVILIVSVCLGVVIFILPEKTRCALTCPENTVEVKTNIQVKGGGSGVNINTQSDTEKKNKQEEDEEIDDSPPRLPRGGGQAFPVPCGENDKWYNTSCEGMAILDYFAAKAMQSIIIRAKDCDYAPVTIANFSYVYAKYMLEERDRLVEQERQAVAEKAKQETPPQEPVRDPQQSIGSKYMFYRRLYLNIENYSLTNS